MAYTPSAPSSLTYPETTAADQLSGGQTWTVGTISGASDWEGWVPNKAAVPLASAGNHAAQAECVLPDGSNQAFVDTTYTLSQAQVLAGSWQAGF